jgi:hypothetical protein
MSLCTSCSVCTVDIKELDEKIFCYGKCLGIFHLKCAKVKQSVYKAITENAKNVKYLCDKCTNSDFGLIHEKLSKLTSYMNEKEECIQNQRFYINKQEESVKNFKKILKTQ